MNQLAREIEKQMLIIVVCPNERCINHTRDMKNHPFEYALKGTQTIKQGHGCHELRYRKTFRTESRVAQCSKSVEHFVNYGPLPSQKIQCKKCEKVFTVKQSNSHQWLDITERIPILKYSTV